MYLLSIQNLELTATGVKSINSDEGKYRQGLVHELHSQRMEQTKQRFQMKAKQMNGWGTEIVIVLQELSRAGRLTLYPCVSLQ